MARNACSGSRRWVNFAKGLLKILIVGSLAAVILWNERHTLDLLVQIDPGMMLHSVQSIAVKLMLGILVLFFFRRDRGSDVSACTLAQQAAHDAQGTARRIQADRGKPRGQGQDETDAPGAFARAHDGFGARCDCDHHQPHPLCGCAEIRTGHAGPDLRRQGRRSPRPAHPQAGKRARCAHCREPAACPAPCMPVSRSRTKSRWSTTRPWPKSSVTSCGCGAFGHK